MARNSSTATPTQGEPISTTTETRTRRSYDDLREALAIFPIKDGVWLEGPAKGEPAVDEKGEAFPDYTWEDWYDDLSELRTFNKRGREKAEADLAKFAADRPIIIKYSILCGQHIDA